MQITKQKSMLSQLRELEVGQMVSFPLSKLATVKSSCVTFGIQWEKKFATKINHATKTIDVTRQA